MQFSLLPLSGGQACLQLFTLATQAKNLKIGSQKMTNSSSFWQFTALQ